MNEFAQQQAELLSVPAQPIWEMGNLHRSLPQSSISAPGDTALRSWATDFGLHMQSGQIPESSALDAGEFARFQNAMHVSVGDSTSRMLQNQRMATYTPRFLNHPRPSMMIPPNMQSAFHLQEKPPTVQNGKARLVELNDDEWEEEFAQLQTEEGDVDAEARAAIEAELQGLDSETDHFGDFESIWRGIQAETQNARQLAEEELFDQGLGIEDWHDFDRLNPHSADLPSVGNYLFEQHNPFQDRSNPFAEGVEIMDSGGNLSLAALAFEAAVQKNTSHVDAWVRLGAAQAQNEKEIPAIRALEAAVKHDANNLEALMSLAVSYTNEGYETTAYRTLERWVSIKYPHLLSPPLDEAKQFGFTQRLKLHQKVTDLFIQAAQLSPSGEEMDPDVQVGLGVLFYAADEFDKAIDCFESALGSTENGVVNRRQNLHLLWNRLGATMANSGRSEEAVQAYEHALELRPNFVRARYNLGVSCINMGVLPEAAEHLLDALEMHRVDEIQGRQKAREIVQAAAGAGQTSSSASHSVSDQDIDRLLTQNQSTNLYDTLRRVFTSMGRRDLTDLVGPGLDPRKLRSEFTF